MEVLWDFNVWLRLFEGVKNTLYISFIAIFISIVGGFLLGLFMQSKWVLIRGVCRLYLEAIRIIPLIAWLFVVYFGLAQYFSLGALQSSILVFSLWGIAEAGDLVRGAMSAVPVHQTESARALGLDAMQIKIFIVIPQAVLQLLPSSLNLFTRMIKTTALVSLIGVVDLLKVGQQIIETKSLESPMISFWIYGLIFVIYFLLCYCLSFLGEQLEKRIKN
ncbi:amino acid ABC transporter permease [Helicobacter anatolicus]|uniref:amino acid ABC transporter permease n=1 Tax=Helicobacter anatolicus TaxID=2905874 RepID=UPI001E620494|nr:amino acid ABC transporter permease [Helicobacter anatolicus]